MQRDQLQEKVGRKFSGNNLRSYRRGRFPKVPAFTIYSSPHVNTMNSTTLDWPITQVQSMYFMNFRNFPRDYLIPIK